MSAAERVAGADGAPLLELDDVQAYYGLAHILQGITLTVHAGELVALLGRNGAGKTTTVKSIMGLVTVRGGHIRCSGRDVVGHPTENIAQFGIGYVPEDRRMFPGLTVSSGIVCRSSPAGRSSITCGGARSRSRCSSS